MKLTYLDQPAPAGSGAPAVVALHREALVGPGGLHELAELARSAGAGRVVVPVGNYASYPSGMEIGGTCWYRILPGYAGTDPISLATAVVQLGDLLEDLEPSWGSGPPVLVGWGQGAVVGLGAALLWPGRVASVVCVDAVPAHVALLPGRSFEPGRRPPVLLAASEPPAEPERDRCRATLAGHGVAAEVQPLPEPGGLSELLTGWLGALGGASAGERGRR